VLGLPPSSWADLARISGGEIIYLGSIILIINYPALSAAISGRDGMDGGRAHWMTLPFREVPSISCSGKLLGSWARFFIEKKRVYY
jgi:hypothetical protein